MSTHTTYQPLREAGAKARAMLLAAAAQRWNVDAATLRTDDGKVLNGSKALTYGALADAASKLSCRRRSRSRIRRISLRRQAAEAARHADEGGRQREVRPRLRACPACCFAVIARPPVIGAKLSKLDASRGACRAGSSWT
jgi:isoquinoline 1-oxidoreductase beta subunit